MLAAFPGAPARITNHPAQSGASISVGTTTAIAASTTKTAFVGQFFHRDKPTSGAPKTINGIGFRAGSITSAGGSNAKVSFQSISTPAGPPMQPDGTVDQYREFALSALATNTWYDTGLITTDGTDTGGKRTLYNGELVAVVFEYGTGGRAGSDSWNLSCVTGVDSGQNHLGMAVHNAGSWAILSQIPNIVFACSDGTFGTLLGAFPFSALTTISGIDPTDTPDEYGLQMQFPGPVSIVAGGLSGAVITADADYLLYSDTTVIDGPVTIDNQHAVNASSVRYSPVVLSAERMLAANTPYILGFKAASSAAHSLQYFDVSAAGHLDCHVGGQSWKLMGRTDGGAWSAQNSSKRVPLFALWLSQIDDGTGGGRANFALGV